LDAALIRKLAQPQAALPSAPAGVPADVAATTSAVASPEVDVPDAVEATAAMATTGALRLPGASAVAASVSTPRPVQPTRSVAAPAPSGPVTSQPGNPPAGQRFPLDKQVIAALASGETRSVREDGEQVTNDEASLPQTQMDVIKRVFAPEMQD
jgi:hypothetical protein